jgi:spore germination cell wall hydrolase CwlJ-like protein
MATAKPKSTKATPDGLARLSRPRAREDGLKIIAKAQDEAAAKRNASTPEATPKDEYLRLMAEKIVAEARLEVATEKRNAEADAKAESPNCAQVEHSPRPTTPGSPRKPRPKTPRSKTRSRPNGSA